jgi:hypothetical protein
MKMRKNKMIMSCEKKQEKRRKMGIGQKTKRERPYEE